MIRMIRREDGTGSNRVSQYNKPIRDRFENLSTTRKSFCSGFIMCPGIIGWGKAAQCGTSLRCPITRSGLDQRNAQTLGHTCRVHASPSDILRNYACRVRFSYIAFRNRDAR